MNGTGQEELSTRPWLTAERLGAFTDGVMAIIITILVLEIDIPRDYDFAEQGVGTFLETLGLEVRIYLISFLLIGTYWLLHHVLFHYVVRVNRAFIAWNCLFLFLISLSPVTTDLAGEYRHVPVLQSVFGLNYMLSGVVFYVMWWYCTRNPYLLRRPVSPEVRRSMDIRLLIAPVLSLLGILVSTVSLPYGSLVFVAIPFFYLRHRLVDKSWNLAK